LILIFHRLNECREVSLSRREPLGDVNALTAEHDRILNQTAFSEGQCFRMTLNRNSMLNQPLCCDASGKLFKVRPHDPIDPNDPNPIRSCRDEWIGPDCLWVGLDVLPD
jgi:hypothetical protein